MNAGAPQAALPTTGGDALAGLRDIHLPAAVSAWPPAPGWWVVGAVSLAIAISAVLWGRRRWRRQAYRRAALRALQELDRQWQQHGDAAVYIAAVNALLKQTALCAYPRQAVAALNGPAWGEFLDRGLRTPCFAGAAAQALAALYSGQAKASAPAALQSAATTWIRRHRC